MKATPLSLSPSQAADLLAEESVLICTIGDPTSIGPEVALKAIKVFLKNTKTKTKVLLCGPQLHLEKVARSSKLNLASMLKSKKLFLFDAESFSKTSFILGHPNLISAKRALLDLDCAIILSKKAKSAALVTGPVDKSWIAQISPGFVGHTDYLRDKTGAKASTMVLAGSSLKVALVTTHIALKEVSRHLNEETLAGTLQRFNAYLRRLQKSKPKIAVLGLNPHASDRGLIGDEEEKVIIPCLEKQRREGLDVFGPFSADSFFFEKYLEFDGVVATYHDQGLIPLKTKHFYDAVNITLGLDFLRVSVDHGTAFDIAGKGIAKAVSYGEALKVAAEFLRTSPVRSDQVEKSRHSNSRRART